ncbi:MAG: ferritin-like protein [Proteobacteria bacterium]|nr:ferritin-like protein [Pseudomonadota bacterium]
MKENQDYLTGPRIHFAGRFIADPSTINNNDYSDCFKLAATLSVEEFKKQVTDAKAEKTLPNGQKIEINVAGWNPYGTGRWSFENSVITNACDQEGNITDRDEVVGYKIVPGNSRTEGKIVDLDPDQQMASQIWGFKVRLVNSMQQTVFSGNYKTTSFQDIWKKVATDKRGNPYYGSFYHSILEEVEWKVSADAISSKVLKELYGMSKLSIRFSVDGYVSDSAAQDFTSGRVVGTIGAYSDTLPYSFSLGRALMVKGDSGKNFNRCYARLFNKRLMLDLANSFQTTSPGGALADVGALYVALIHNQEMVVLSDKIPYSTDGWYEKTAGIFTISLSEEQIQLLSSSVLTIVDENRKIVISEYYQGALAGYSIKAEKFVYRLNMNDRESVKLFVTRFGQPVENADIHVALSQGNPTAEGLILGGLENGMVKTNKDGAACFDLIGGDPKHPREFIDGQIYQVTYTLIDGMSKIPADYRNQSDVINVLVWDKYEIPEVPTWVANVEPIFRQYANLYPIMQRMFNLASYESVTTNLDSLKVAFSADTLEEDPHYMPVTRDLSRNKRAMIRKWLDNPVYNIVSNTHESAITTIEQLRIVLQDAISLELSTIPPYLCALYSIKPGYNQEVAAILRSIVMEEMLHVALVCNILNAVGGTPKLNDPDYIPNYPGELPHGINGGLNITLGPLSKQRIKEIFMRIEAPEEIATIKDPSGVDLDASTSNESRFTIGEFYTGIKIALRRLCETYGEDKVFSGDRSRQLTDWQGTRDNIVVENFKTALLAIDKIITQGEGVSKANPAAEAETLAHYYRFWEVLHGKAIRARYKPDGTCAYEFTTEEIHFDEAGIYPMAVQTGPIVLDGHPKEKNLSNRFNEMYARLLNSLHSVFNGYPKEINSAIGIMRNLQLIAQDLMKMPVPGDADRVMGPSFECHPYLEKKRSIELPILTVLPSVMAAESKVVLPAASVRSLFQAPGISLFSAQHKNGPKAESRVPVDKIAKTELASATPNSEVSAIEKDPLVGHKFK